MANVARCLARLLAHHHALGVDEAEGVDNDLALDGLDGVDDDGHGAILDGLERLLGVDVDRGQPAAKAGVRVVPADDDFGAAGLGEHVDHLCLEHVVDRLDADSCSWLRQST